MDENTHNLLVNWVRLDLGEMPDLEDNPTQTCINIYKKKASSPDQLRYLRTLIHVSKTNKWAWEALRLISQERLRKGEWLSSELVEWIVSVLEHPRRRPSKRPGRYDLRDYFIAAWVRRLVSASELGLTATRNIRQRRVDLPHCCRAGGSAADIVGEAAGLTYKNVERIWKNRPPALS